jgi:hypothetical protein
MLGERSSSQRPLSEGSGSILFCLADSFRVECACSRLPPSRFNYAVVCMELRLEQQDKRNKYAVRKSIVKYIYIYIYIEDD